MLREERASRCFNGAADRSRRKGAHVYGRPMSTDDELEALRDELIDARRTNDWREQNYALRRAAGVPVAALHVEAVAMVRDIAAAAAAARGTEIRVGDTVSLLGTETEGTVTDIWNGRLEVCWLDPAAPAAVVVRHRPSELRLVRRAVET